MVQSIPTEKALKKDWNPPVHCIQRCVSCF